MKKIIFFLFFICQYSYAQLVNLTCIDPKDNFTIDFQLNESERTVIYQGKSIFANYDVGSISFTVTMSNGNQWHHMISRTTGNLMIQNVKSGDFLTSTWRCSVEKRKF